MLYKYHYYAEKQVINMNTLVSYSIMTSTMTYDPGSLEYKFSVRFWGGRLGIFLFFLFPVLLMMIVMPFHATMKFGPVLFLCQRHIVHPIQSYLGNHRHK